MSKKKTANARQERLEAARREQQAAEKKKAFVLYGAAAAAVVMPALAVAEDGMRLGQGGGYYDRFLAELPQAVPTVALVFEDELLPAGAIPAEPTDRPVDGVVTAAGLRWV